MYLPSVVLTIDLKNSHQPKRPQQYNADLVVSSCFRNSVRVITVTFLDSIGPVPLSFPPGGTDQNLLCAFFGSRV